MKVIKHRKKSVIRFNKIGFLIAGLGIAAVIILIAIGKFNFLPFVILISLFILVIIVAIIVEKTNNRMINNGEQNYNLSKQEDVNNEKY